MFNLALVVRVYETLTSQARWRQEIGDLLASADLDRSRSLRCLDLGCGPGESAFVLADTVAAGSEIIGIDISPAMIARAQALATQRPVTNDLRFEQADATSLPFATGSFDLAIGHSFLYLVRDPLAVLRETRRLLAPGGHLLLLEPNATGSLVRALFASRKVWGASLMAPLTTARFAASMILWRLVSGTAGRLSAPQVEGWFREAGFEPVRTAPALGGLGLRCLGGGGPAQPPA